MEFKRYETKEKFLEENLDILVKEEAKKIKIMEYFLIKYQKKLIIGYLAE